MGSDRALARRDSSPDYRLWRNARCFCFHFSAVSCKLQYIRLQRDAGEDDAIDDVQVQTSKRQPIVKSGVSNLGRPEVEMNGF